MGISLGLTLLMWVIGLFILYVVISAAINGSDLAYDVRLIRKMMEKELKIETIEDDEGEEPADAIPLKSESECPGCGTALSGTEPECPNCGLRLL